MNVKMTPSKGTTAHPSRRRKDALSREQIVETAITLLDMEGESALTFRALMSRLSTGAGALYWHVADKEELLVASADTVIASSLNEVKSSSESLEKPIEVIQAVALAVFDAIEAHPWLGAQLLREPWQAAILQVIEGLGRPLQALGVPQEQQFNAVTVLLNYILGLAGQYAAGARLLPLETERTAFLEGVAASWKALDPLAYPFVHKMAEQLPQHDDREQFLAGFKLILGGMIRNSNK